MIFSVFQKTLAFGYSWSTLLWYRCYYPHRSRDALSPVCGIFFFFFSWFSLAIFFIITSDFWSIWFSIYRFLHINIILYPTPIDEAAPALSGLYVLGSFSLKASRPWGRNFVTWEALGVVCVVVEGDDHWQHSSADPWHGRLSKNCSQKTLLIQI